MAIAVNTAIWPTGSGIGSRKSYSCRAVSRSARYWYRWADPPATPLPPARRSVDAERVRDASGKRLHDAWGVEDDGDRYREDDELHEPDYLTSEQKENSYDTDNPEKQRSEQALQIAHKAGGAQRRRGRHDEQVRRHLSTPGL